MTTPAPSSPLPSPCVWTQNAPVCAFKTFSCARGAGIHGDVLNVHTEAFLNPHTSFSTFFQRAATHTHQTHTTHNTHTNAHTTRTPTHHENTTKPRHHATPHTAPTQGTNTSHTTHHDTSRTPHTIPQPVHRHTNTHFQHTRTTTQQVQTLNCLIHCLPSWN